MGSEHAFFLHSKKLCLLKLFTVYRHPSKKAWNKRWCLSCKTCRNMKGLCRTHSTPQKSHVLVEWLQSESLNYFLLHCLSNLFLLLFFLFFFLLCAVFSRFFLITQIIFRVIFFFQLQYYCAFPHSYPLLTQLLQIIWVVFSLAFFFFFLSAIHFVYG